MSRHRAQHRLTTQPTRWLPHINPLWWLLPAAVVVSAGVLTAAVTIPGPAQYKHQLAHGILPFSVSHAPGCSLSTRM